MFNIKTLSKLERTNDPR